MIGPGWLTAQYEWGNKRLDNPTDWVHRELAYALEPPPGEEVLVVPVLVEEADISIGSDVERALPAPLRALVERDAVRASHDAWERSLAPLIDRIRSLLGGPSSDEVATPASEPAGVVVTVDPAPAGRPPSWTRSTALCPPTPPAWSRRGEWNPMGATPSVPFLPVGEPGAQ